MSHHIDHMGILGVPTTLPRYALLQLPNGLINIPAFVVSQVRVISAVRHTYIVAFLEHMFFKRYRTAMYIHSKAEAWVISPLFQLTLLTPLISQVCSSPALIFITISCCCFILRVNDLPSTMRICNWMLSLVLLLSGALSSDWFQLPH